MVDNAMQQTQTASKQQTIYTKYLEATVCVLWVLFVLFSVIRFSRLYDYTQPVN